MKKTILLAGLIATLSTSLFSCKKDDSISPANPGAAAAATRYSACDSTTHTRMNLDTGKPCHCAL